MEQTSIPKGFTAEEWAHAIASGRVILVPTTPQPHKLFRLLAAPVQFARWTISARMGTRDAASHKWDRALPFVR